MSLDAVALLRIPGFEPPDELDVRVLEDEAVLVYLEQPFETDLDELVDRLAERVGEGLLRHDDARGILFFPDAAEPEEAESYEAVVSAVEGHGAWAAPDKDVDAAQALHQGVQSVLDDALSAMGLGGVSDFARLLTESDPSALEEARLRAQRAFESAMAKSREPGEPEK